MAFRTHMIFIAIVNAFLITSCGKSPPKCSDEATLNLVRDLTFTDHYSEKELKEIVAFEHPHATAEDKDIKKISCEAKMVVANTYKIPISYESQLDDENQHLVSVERLKLNAGDYYALSVAMQEAVEKTRTQIKTSESAPVVSNKKGASSAYAPFLNTSEKITLGNCHMGSCSWSKWLSVLETRITNAEEDLEISMLGGSSEHDEETDYLSSPKGVAIKWNSSPHTIYVRCSHTKPSVSIDGQEEILPLSTNANIPDLLFSSISTYFEACHSDFSARPIEETIKMHGYNVILPENENQ